MIFGRSKKNTGRILVIEDDWDILEVLKLMLEYEGHQVVTAKHGKAALAAAEARPFDVVVMDISMPEMSGIDVARALRASPKTADVYIVIHTGLDEHWVRERFDDYDVFLTKAEDADILVQEIARLLALPKSPEGGRLANQAEPEFDFDDTIAARRALRQEMSLGPESFSLDAFLASVGAEIEQLRKLGRSDEDIAAVLSKALDRTLPASFLQRRQRAR